MDSSPRTALIVNPAARNGRLGKHWPEIERLLREAIGPHDVFMTERRGHATELTRAALRGEYRRVISAGGDGTHNEVLNGFFDGVALVQPEATLGILPYGTGSDFARTLRTGKGPEAMQALRAGRTVLADIGRVQFKDGNGNDGIRHFLNIADFGVGGEVVQRVNETTKFFGGFASFLWAVLTTLATHKNAEMIIEAEGNRFTGRISNVIVAKGQYYGGGMHVAPFARLDNGVFDVYVIGDVGRAESFVNLPKVYLGGLHRRVDKVRYLQTRRLTAMSPSRVLVNTDGEQPGRLPLEISLVPQALRVITGLRYGG